MLPLHIWAPLGTEAWQAGRRAIQRGAFVFEHTPEDRAYADLKRYARQQAKSAVAEFEQQGRLPQLTPADRTRLTLMYVHAFVNGAFDQILAEMPPAP